MFKCFQVYSYKLKCFKYGFQEDDSKNTNEKDSGSNELPIKSEATEQTPQHHITMLNKLGQKYHCSLPIIQDEPNLSSDGTSSEDSKNQNTGEKRNLKVMYWELFLGL